eukprot:797389_1
MPYYGTVHVIHLVLPPEHDNLARDAGGQAYGQGQSQPVSGMTDHPGAPVVDSMPHPNGRIMVLRNGHVMTPLGMQPGQLNMLPQMSSLARPATLPEFTAARPTGNVSGMVPHREQARPSTRYFNRIATAPGAAPGCVCLPVSVAALPPDQLTSLLRHIYGLRLQQGTPPHMIVHTAPSQAQTPIAGRISGVSEEDQQPVQLLIIAPSPKLPAQSRGPSPKYPKLPPAQSPAHSVKSHARHTEREQLTAKLVGFDPATNASHLLQTWVTRLQRERERQADWSKRRFFGLFSDARGIEAVLRAYMAHRGALPAPRLSRQLCGLCLYGRG